MSLSGRRPVSLAGRRPMPSLPRKKTKLKRGLAKDPRYDLDKDVVDGKLVLIGGGNVDTATEEGGEENVVNLQAEPEPHFEQIFEPL
ncbi:hypothetical protein VNO80_06804 [Phaseolus coccineus]|uniref:Uncharacterized protein n=1 Tax=Phaseolus coccineus TaxID=3886 RepID=A0AAN9RJA1_PHACN